jgi:long-chain acyl-CoA synthetase
MIYSAAKACRTNTPMEHGDTCANFYPLFWIAGEDVGLLFPIFTATTCVLFARWDALGYMAAVERYKVNRSVLLVDNAVELMDHPRACEFNLTSLETTGVSSFVKKLNPDYRARWRELTGATMFELSYGMTETHTCDSFTRGLQGEDFDLSLQPILCGLPVPGTEFKICDFETHVLLALDQEGEICVRSPSTLKSYWQRPDATDESLVNGWLRTGDIGVIDSLGLLHFLGRRKEMLKIKGMSVFPAEIEALLGRHPAIIGSGVIGRPDAERGQVPVAFVCLHPEKAAELSADDIAAWCKDTMATYKLPEIRIIKALPMTATGKVKKGELEELL